MKTDPTFWILARASGLTAYLLVTASVVAGIMVKSRPFRSLKPAAQTDVHRFLALLGLGMLVLHGLSILADKTVKMPLLGLFVPGLSPYRPLAVGLGVLAAELMLLVYVSFSLRSRIGVRNWRRLHFASYAVFLMGAIHGITAGTDTASPWAKLLYLATIGLVAGATAWRVMTVKRGRKGAERAPRAEPAERAAAA